MSRYEVVNAFNLGLIALAGLTGCATPVSEQRSMLETAAVCCTSMSEFKYTPLVISDEKDITLGAESPAYVFETGKSFFAAYRLPAWSGPYQIRAEAQSRHLRSGMFAPSVLVLDRDFKVTRRFNIDDRGSSPRSGIVHIFVNEPNQNEQYLVLFNARTDGSVETLQAMPTTIMVGTAPVVIGATESRVSVPYAPTGSLQLKVWPYQPQKANQPRTD